jgi:hypothetical protein
VPVNKYKSLTSSNFVPYAMASGSCQSSFDPDDLSSDDKEYLTPNNEAVMTPRQIDSVDSILIVAMLHLNSLPEVPKNCGQIYPNLNAYHTNPVEISIIFWIPHIADCWRQQKEMHTKYANRSNVACDIFSIIPHSFGGEASFSLGRDMIG